GEEAGKAAAEKVGQAAAEAAGKAATEAVAKEGTLNAIKGGTAAVQAGAKGGEAYANLQVQEQMIDAQQAELLATVLRKLATDLQAGNADIRKMIEAIMQRVNQLISEAQQGVAKQGQVRAMVGSAGFKG